MGWLAGVLSGYADRHHQIRQENAALAEEASKREADVYSRLLNSTDPKLQEYGATGILQMGQPRKGKSGFAGWMGEMESSPVYPLVQKYMRTPQPVPDEGGPTAQPGAQPGTQPAQPIPPTGVPGPQAHGYLPQAPSGSSSLAQPSTSPTQGAPMATPQPLPGSLETDPAPPPGPPPPPFIDPTMMAESAGGPSAAPPAPPAAALTPSPSPLTPPPAPPGFSPSAAQPMPAAAAAPPMPAPPMPAQPTASPAAAAAVAARPPTMQLPHFPTVEDAEIKAARAKYQAQFTVLRDALRQAGDPNPDKRAAEALVAELTKGSGGTGYKPIVVEYTDPVSGKKTQDWASYDPKTARFLGRDLNPLPLDAKPYEKPTSAGSNRALNKHEEIANMLFNVDGSKDPIDLAKHLSQQQHQRVFDEAAKLDAEAKLRSATTIADAPLNREAKLNAIEKYATEWRNIQKPQDEMVRQVQNMNAALGRFPQDPNGASQAVITTFEKILNPNSIVRQAAYERSPEYLSILDRIQGMGERYWGRWDAATNTFKGGGAGVPLEDLKALAETARQFAVAQANDNEGERQRLVRRAAENNIDPRDIFGNTAAVPPAFGDAPPRAPTTVPAKVAPNAPAVTGKDLFTMSPDGVLLKNGEPLK